LQRNEAKSFVSILKISLSLSMCYCWWFRGWLSF